MKFLTHIFLLLIVEIGFSQNSCYTATNSIIFNYNSHSYKIIKELKNWTNAASCAVSDGGYLVEINDTLEQNAVYNGIIGASVSSSYHNVGGSSYIWIGATDKNSEGVWLWDGNNDNVGINFWNGQGTAGSGVGSIMGTSYVNWGGKSLGIGYEPNDFMSNEDCAGICLSSWTFGNAGEWNDIDASNTLYYIIEYNSLFMGIEESNKRPDPIVYPNPSSNSLSITGSFRTIALINNVGKTLNVVMHRSNEKTIIDISQLVNGIYFLKYTDLLDNQTTQKIIINNIEEK